MSGVAQPAVERLRAFLKGLPPGSRALLIGELERSLLRGEDIGGSELILGELRRSFRDNDPSVQRIGDAPRLFFRPLEPFLVDETTAEPSPGRIARDALEPVWRWISAHLVADEAKVYADEIGQALAGHDEHSADRIARRFQDLAVERMRAAVDAVANDRKAARRLGAHIGAPRGLDDVEAVLQALEARDALAAFEARLPGHLKSLIGPSLEAVRALLDPHAEARSPFFSFALVLLLGRLAQPWQLIRLATSAAHSDTSARIAETAYALAVTIVLSEVDGMVRELEGDLKSGRGIAVTARLRDIHDAMRGLRSELDLGGDSAWGRQLTSLRARISRMLTGEIETVPGRVRRLLRVKQARDVAPGEALDATEADETVSRIGFVMACRNFAGELAINEVTQRTVNELQQTLDSGTRSLLDALRGAGEADRRFRSSQIDAAVRFCAPVFGQDYAALLSKAAEVAVQGSEWKPDAEPEQRTKASVRG